MAKVKISGLDPATTLDGTELIELEQGGGSVQCTTQDIADLGGGGASYLKYIALLSQSGTDAPVATVLENTLGGAVVWTRDEEGVYIGTLAGTFTTGKTWCSISGDGDSALGTSAARTTEDTVQFYTLDATGAFIDGFSIVSLEIRVYP